MHYPLNDPFSLVLATNLLRLLDHCSELDFWVESSPPSTSLISGPRQNQTVPSTVMFNFSSTSGSGTGIPISISLCRLVQLSAVTAQQSAAAPVSAMSLPGSSHDPARSRAWVFPSKLSEAVAHSWQHIQASPVLRANSAHAQIMLKLILHVISISLISDSQKNTHCHPPTHAWVLGYCPWPWGYVALDPSICHAGRRFYDCFVCYIRWEPPNSYI